MKPGIDKQNSCEGKLRYGTMSEANLAVTNLNKSKSAKKRMGGYKCSFCGKYHVGHTKRQASNQEKKRLKLNPIEYKINADLSSGYCIIKNAI